MFDRTTGPSAFTPYVPPPQPSPKPIDAIVIDNTNLNDNQTVSPINNIYLHYSTHVHLSKAKEYNDQGIALVEKGEFSQAVDIFLMVLQMELPLLGSDHINIATCYQNIACCLKNLGKYSEALWYLKKCLCILCLNLGPDDLRVASIYKSIGDVSNELKSYYAAIPCYLQSLRIERQLLGENHSSVISTYNRIKATYLNIGNNPKAFDNFMKAWNSSVNKLEFLAEKPPLNPSSFQERHYELSRKSLFT